MDFIVSPADKASHCAVLYCSFLIVGYPVCLWQYIVRF